MLHSWKPSVMKQYEDFELPWEYDGWKKEVQCIRQGVSIASGDAFSSFFIQGEKPENLEKWAQKTFSRPLKVRPFKLMQAFMVVDGKLIDVTLTRLKKGFLLLARPLNRALLKEAVLKSTLAYELNCLDQAKSHQCIRMDGPFSWDFLAEFYEPEVAGLPYLSCYQPDEHSVLMRMGDTGEYGYVIVCLNEFAPELESHLKELGQDFDLMAVGEKALSYCKAENFFFDESWMSSAAYTPYQMQQQWRVAKERELDELSYQSNYKAAQLTAVILENVPENVLGEGAANERRRKSKGGSLGESKNEDQQWNVYLKDTKVGRLEVCWPFVHSPRPNVYIGYALMDAPFAEAGLEGFELNVLNELRISMKTVAPPLVNNLSLSIDPQVHAYEVKEEVKAPPIYAV